MTAAAAVYSNALDEPLLNTLKVPVSRRFSDPPHARAIITPRCVRQAVLQRIESDNDGDSTNRVVDADEAAKARLVRSTCQGAIAPRPHRDVSRLRGML